MLRINKVSEYGVLALGYIGNRSEPLSAREISEGLQAPYELMAKTLQRLKESGFIQSVKGTHGGYRLQSSLNEISLSAVIESLEGPVAIIECAEHRTQCSRDSFCGLKMGMQKVNLQIRNVLNSVTLEDLLT